MSANIELSSQQARLFYFLVRYSDIELRSYGNGTMIYHCDYVGAYMYIPLPIEQVKSDLASMKKLVHNNESK